MRLMFSTTAALAVWLFLGGVSFGQAVVAGALIKAGRVGGV